MGRDKVTFSAAGVNIAPNLINALGGEVFRKSRRIRRKKSIPQETDESPEIVNDTTTEQNTQGTEDKQDDGFSNTIVPTAQK